MTALTGVGPERLAAVSRLFVAPAARGRHLGVLLLAALSSYAEDEDLQLMLDVVEDGGPSVTLYERLGWQLVDHRTTDWATPEGLRLPVRIYIAPDRKRPSPAPS